MVGAISVHGINGIWGVISLGLFANGKYGVGWNGVVRDEIGPRSVRHAMASAGLFYGDPSQFRAQLLDAGGVDRLRLRHGLRLVQDQQPDRSRSGSARKWNWKASTCPKWVRRPTPISR